MVANVEDRLDAEVNGLLRRSIMKAGRCIACIL